MTDRLPGAMMLSLTLHASVAGLMLLFGYAASLSNQDTTKVFQIVAGEGDNFAAEVAPALGEPGGIKVEVPTPPAPTPEPVVQPEPAPVVPTPPAPVEKPPPKLTNLTKMIEKKVARADTKAKAQVAKEREIEAKKMSKKEFDELNKKNSGPTPKPAGPTKVAKLDPEGIRKGVVGGSTENKTGGAGGRDMVATGEIMDRYFALLQERLRSALEKPPGLSDTLVTVVQVRLGADGSITGAHITKSSGSDEFDRAAMAAVAAVRMPARPDKKSEVLNLPFRMKEKDDG
ncbi:MAG TPA: cell envelope integrity protein TolA [Opitutaceae bacterium]|nr:cell envelope integrity protein TolA [Opitutaceae bacterium]